MKKISLILIIVMMSLMLTPFANAAEQEVTKYPLWVGGRQVTSLYLENETEGWSYDPASYKLSLKDAKITGTGEENYKACIFINTVPSTLFTIDLAGENKVGDGNNTYGIRTGSSQIVITGKDGSLTVSGKCAIDGGPVLRINGTTVTLTGSDRAIDVAGPVSFSGSTVYVSDCRLGICGENISIKDSRVDISCSEFGIISFDDLSVSGESYVEAASSGFVAVNGIEYKAAVIANDRLTLTDVEILEPEGSEIRDDYIFERETWVSVFEKDSTVPADKVVIGKAYPVWIGTEQITTGNMRDLTLIDGVDAAKDGGASYDPKTSTLTLNNTSVTKTHIPESYSAYAVSTFGTDLNIVLKGENKAVCQDATYAIFGEDAHITFDGDGTLEAAAERIGLYAYMGSVTVNGGKLTLSGGNAGIECDQADGSVVTVNGGSVKASGDNFSGIIVRKLVINAGRVESETKNADLSYQTTLVSALTYETEIVLGENIHMTLPENGEFMNYGTGDDLCWHVTDGKDRVMKCVIEEAGIIMFLGENDTVLQSVPVGYGTSPAYTGKTPEKEGNAQYTYTFAGWKDKDGKEYKPADTLPAVTGDASYTAFFSSTVNEYTVTFRNEDGTELQSSKVKYGEEPSYTGNTPEKEENEKYTYKFSGWTPALETVKGDIEYTAEFEAVEKPVYTVTEGGDASWTLGSGKPLKITVKRDKDDDTCFDHFTDVMLDGKKLDDSAYAVERGSTVITLSAETLETMSKGTHTVTVNFDDGQAETGVTVEEKITPPATGDTGSTGLWTALTLFSALGTGFLSLRRRRHS